MQSDVLTIKVFFAEKSEKKKVDDVRETFFVTINKHFLVAAESSNFFFGSNKQISFLLKNAF